MTEPDWVRHAIWWQVYPLGLGAADTTGADRACHGGLRTLIERLDHAVRLGASGLLLGPVFASGTHGYDTVDHFRIDERLGTEDDFDSLVAGCRDRGLRLLLDGVFNHVGRSFAAPDDWFVDDGGDRAVFEGHPGLVRLEHRSPAVAEHVARVMTHWLDRGADGWRLDAAYAVPAEFWAGVLPRVRDRHPDAYIVGEMIHGDYAGYAAEGGLDSVTQYELWKAIWSSLSDGNFFELSHALQRHQDLLDTFVPQTFVGNHDVTRLASRIADRRHVAHAVVVLATIAGTPSVYYGDELGLTGVKEDRVGGDDAVRPSAAALDVGDDAAATLRLHQDLLGLRRRHAWLHDARTEVVHLENTRLAYESFAGEQRLRVLLNLDGQPWTFEGTAVPAHGWSVPGESSGQPASGR